MSMASYNLLKAAADGLADAINYRTNLKRRRREEEYNYNRDWQRNENEYQRDLGRKRDELDYMTDYNWKQEQRAYDRDMEREKIKREDRINKAMEFYRNNPSENVNPKDFASVVRHNALIAANEVPIPAIKYQEPEKPFEQTLKEKEAMLQLQNKYGKQMADYESALRRQEKPNLTQFERNANFLFNLKPEQRKMLEEYGYIPGMPNAVKGGGKGAVIGGNNISAVKNTGIPHIDKQLRELQEEINKMGEKITQIENENKIDIGKYEGQKYEIQQNANLSPEQKKDAIAAIENARKAKEQQTSNLLNSLKQQKKYAEENLKFATNYLYPDFTASGTLYEHVPQLKEQQASDTAQILNSLNKDIENLEGLGQSNPVATHTPPVASYPPSVATHTPPVGNPLFNSPVLNIWETPQSVLRLY